MAPVCQFVIDVVVQLTGQTREFPLTLSLVAMAGGARRDIGARDSLFKYFFTGSHQFLGSPSKRFWIELAETLCESGQHCRPQDMRNIVHNIAASAALVKRFQL